MTVPALVLHLGGHHHRLSLVQPPLHRLVEVPGLVGGQAPHPEALDDEGVVPLQQVVHHAAVRAGDQLQQGHLVVHPVAEDGLRGALRPDIADQPPVLDQGQHRVVDAGEGLEALAPGLPPR